MAIQSTNDLYQVCADRHAHGFCAVFALWFHGKHKDVAQNLYDAKQVFIKASSTGDCYHYSGLSLLYGFTATRETLHKTWHLMPSKS